MRIHFILFVFISTLSMAQEPEYTYIDGSSLRIMGRVESIDSNEYQRIPTEQLSKLPERVQSLSANTAGISIDFLTDSKSIAVKWELDKYRELKNMTPIAVNGVGLYGFKNGKWQFIAVGRPQGNKNSSVLIKNMDGQLRNFRLYLPLYTGVKNISIGVEDGSTISKSEIATVPENKVVIYGSSITQGASASRPGMAFPSILSRHFNAEFLNFGFSGSGKMEIEMAEILKDIEAEMFILDCVPNPSPEQIQERTIPFIKKLREAQPDTPILMVESIFREYAHWDQKWEEKVVAQNHAFKEAYKSLKEHGFKNIFYVSSDGLIGEDHEGTIDGTHFTDLGHLRMAKSLEPYIREIFKLKINH